MISNLSPEENEKLETYTSALKKLLEQKIETNVDLYSLKAHATNLLVRIYGKGCIQIEQIKAVKFQTAPAIAFPTGALGGGDNLIFCRNLFKRLLNNFISELENFGIPTSVPLIQENGINVTVNQSQNVSVEVNIILDLLREELTGKQYKELEAIAKSNDETQSKKAKILEKLASFGSDVASNVLAGILTNPGIWG